MKALATVLAAFCMLSLSGLGAAKDFDIERLPHGKDVTIPRPATTLVGLGARVKFTATDVPQVLSMKAVHTGGGAATAMRISIFDPESERVRYVDLRPGTPYVYAFQELGSITVIPGLPNAAASGNVHHVRLQIESDKPLSIAR